MFIVGDENQPKNRKFIDLHPSRKRFLGEYVVSILLIVGIIYLIFFPLNLSQKIPYIDIELLLMSLFASNFILLMIYVELRRAVEKYSITESGITEETGFFDKHSTNIPLRMIERCEVEENIIQRALKFGDIIIDTGEDFFVMNGISKPEGKMDLINSYLEEMRANF